MIKLYLSLFLLIACSTSIGNSEYFKVIRVVDGDTLVLENIGKVRLIGVDTPETKDPRRPVQYFGKEASQFLNEAANGKKVRIEYDQQRKDKYQRTLAYLYLEDGTLINAKIIQQGYGFAYTRFPFKKLEQFRAYEREAREKGHGLWAVNDQPKLLKKTTTFQCSKKRCRDIKTCDEALYLLKNCGLKHLDKNGDGRPCEALCGR